jgi:predicted RNase H-like HicB family nuclease
LTALAAIYLDEISALIYNYIGYYDSIRRLLTDKKDRIMEAKKYIYWKEDNMLIGYLEEYPDYMTQGETVEQLKENLKDIYHELTGGAIPCVRKVAVLEIS